ncbi:MAG TPA: cellulase [Verrucomicrobiae bacterium]
MKITLQRTVTNAGNIFGVLLAMVLQWPHCATAQSLAAQPPASQPYVWRNVAIGGGGFVTGIIFHPRQKDLMYARTDVGGAYRWDAALKRWIPLTDWISAADVNLTGIESIALDPNDPKRVYLAAGTYGRSDAAILRSDDQGKIFKRTDVTFKMGGNETGRANGERLAVDPNHGEILFFGSRREGLWKSTDRGGTWQKVEGFPVTGTGQTSATASTTTTNTRPRGGGFGRQQSAGIVCVLFDPSSGKPGTPTPTIYAAVSTTTTNLYRSTDAGVTWLAVPDQPVGLCPNHIVRALDGTFYFSYGREPGPNSMSDGAVWKFNPKDGAWTDITPLKPANADQPFGYGAVTVDAQHPSTIMATTFCHWRPHDQIFRSTNGGAIWTQLWQDNTEWDHSSAPYTKTRTPHWMGDIEINPFNSDQVLFTTGYGIWSCVNATTADAGKPTRWVFFNDGLEETVPLALISPPEGAHLISGVGDIDGFRHDDLNVSPPEGTFSGPRFSNTEGLAFAWKNPQVIARAGTGRGAHAAISFDGGKNWKPLGSEPAGGRGAGAIALSADGKTIAWTPRGGNAHVSVDCGTNWVACEGLPFGVAVIADTVNPAAFYAFDPRAGTVLVSTNGAASFITAKSVLPQTENSGGGFGGGGAGVTLCATPGIEGDLWLAFRSRGLYHSRDAGATFTKLSAVQEASSLGFGKAAPGKNHPALFLAGKVADRQALFRSDDTGESWTRINDDQHQFGYVSRVTGDPRIFGRVYFATAGRGIIYGDSARRPANLLTENQ